MKPELKVLHLPSPRQKVQAAEPPNTAGCLETEAQTCVLVQFWSGSHTRLTSKKKGKALSPSFCRSLRWTLV